MPPHAAAPIMLRRAAALSAAVAASLTLAACTAQSSTQSEDLAGVQGEVQDAVERFSDRADNGQAAAICKDSLTPALAQTLAGTGGGTCDAAVKQAVDGADYTSLNVTRVVLGAGTPALRAVAVIDPVDEDAGRRSITLVRAADKQPWLIESFDDEGGVTGTEPATATTGTEPAGTEPDEG